MGRRAPCFVVFLHQKLNEVRSMRRFFLLILAAAACLQTSLVVRGEKAPTAKSGRIEVASADWAWWRGPNLNGIAPDDQTPPLKWSEKENVVWKVPVPGRGHSSPTICGERVFLATAETDPAVQSVLCFNRRTGEELWKAIVHRGGLSLEGLKTHPKASLASSTSACDGKHLYINFYNAGAVYTTALDMSGHQVWQTKVTDYTMHQGFGSSPAVYQSFVLVSADNKGGGVLAALDRATGDIVWKVDRPKLPNYASPIVLNVGGKDQLFLTGCDLVSSFDPLTGNKLWEVKGATTECVTSTVTDGKVIFSSGGFPKNHVAAISADGSGKVIWEKNVKVYVPSMLVRDSYLYAVLDNGVASCWNCETGDVAWTHRLGGNFTASPIMVGDQIFATSEEGKTSIFKADPKSFQLLGDNEIAGETLSTPTICGSRVYLRTAKQDKEVRQEYLYCLGAK